MTRPDGEGTNEAMFRDLFEHAPGAFLVLNPELTIVAVTEVYLRATMTSREQILGRGLFEIFPDNPGDATATGTRNLRESLVRVLRDRVPDTMAVQKYDIRRPESDGGGFEERHWSPVNSPIVGPHGEVRYIIHRVEDVTRFVQLEARNSESAQRTRALEGEAERTTAELLRRSQELGDANRQLHATLDERNRLYEKTRELDHLKTRFFANISHELRTPLTLILGPAERLKAAAAEGSRDQRDLVGVVRNARTLLRHVNDLLDLSKLEAGGMTLNLASQDLARLTRVVVGHFESHAQERGVEMVVEGPEALLVTVDADKIQRVLLNLLSNALRFTPAGGRVRCAVHADGERVLVQVADSGSGIPSAHRAEVFERFRQLDAGDTRQRSGTGLGLSIVREFVELHGGEVTIDDAPEGGALFTITLPQRKCDGDAQPGELPALDATLLTVIESPVVSAAVRVGTDDPVRPRVLVVEDNPDMNRFLCETLAEAYAVESAPDGRSGVAKALAAPPDAILTDMMMPGLSGEDLVREVRAVSALDATPIVLLTARSDDDLRVRVLQNGAQDYVTKPFSADELRARVGNLVATRRAREEVRRLAERLAQRNAELEQRTADLGVANEELEAFSYSVAHDLRAPLRAIDGFSLAVLEDFGDRLDEAGRSDLARVRAAAKRMGALIDDLLALARVSRDVLRPERVDLSREATAVVAALADRDRTRTVAVAVEPGLWADGDPRWLRVVLENLLSNAWKFTARSSDARIEVGRDDTGAFYIRDNGAGFDMAYADRLFRPFQRLHGAREFDGTGIGLAIVARVVRRHQGRVWAEGSVGGGATFRFTVTGTSQEGMS